MSAAEAKFYIEVCLDKISDGFNVQGRMSKVKVTRSKNVIFEVSNGLTCADSPCHVIWRHVTAWCDTGTSRDVRTPLAKNTDKEGTTRDGRQCSSTLIFFFSLAQVGSKTLRNPQHKVGLSLLKEFFISFRSYEYLVKAHCVGPLVVSWFMLGQKSALGRQTYCNINT